jgi:hypothetical protein
MKNNSGYAVTRSDAGTPTYWKRRNETDKNPSPRQFLIILFFPPPSILMRLPVLTRSRITKTSSFYRVLPNDYILACVDMKSHLQVVDICVICLHASMFYMAAYTHVPWNIISVANNADRWAKQHA